MSEHSERVRGKVLSWIRGQPSETPIVAVAAAHDLRRDGIDVLQVASMLGQLAGEGHLRRVFAVRGPDGMVIRKVFRTADDISPSLVGRFGRVFSRDDAEVITAFQQTETTGTL